MGDKRIKNLGIRLIVAGEFYEDKTRYLEIINNKDIDKISLLELEDMVSIFPPLSSSLLPKNKPFLRMLIHSPQNLNCKFSKRRSKLFR